MRKFMLNSQGDADELRVRLKALGADIGASLDTSGESRALIVRNPTDDAMAKVDAELAACGSKRIAEMVPDKYADLVEAAREADAATPDSDGPTIH
jgi:hypothetical protein